MRIHLESDTTHSTIGFELDFLAIAHTYQKLRRINTICLTILY